MGLTLQIQPLARAIQNQISFVSGGMYQSRIDDYTSDNQWHVLCAGPRVLLFPDIGRMLRTIDQIEQGRWN
jgi:hypothetical protein